MFNAIEALDEGLILDYQLDTVRRAERACRFSQGSKYRSKSDCKAIFYSLKIAKRSENIFRLCEANNFYKLQKIVKKCEIAKKILSL
jgi:hypothetical protein